MSKKEFVKIGLESSVIKKLKTRGKPSLVIKAIVMEHLYGGISDSERQVLREQWHCIVNHLIEMGEVIGVDEE